MDKEDTVAICILSGQSDMCDPKQCPMIKKCYPEYKDESRLIQDVLPTTGSRVRDSSFN